MELLRGLLLNYNIRWVSGCKAIEYSGEVQEVGVKIVYASEF